MNFLIRGLNKQVHSFIKDVAKRKGISMNELIQMILEDYMKNNDAANKTMPEVYLERQEVFYYAIERNNNILDFFKHKIIEENII